MRNTYLLIAALSTAVGLSNITLADQLEDYNEANGYSGEDVLSEAEAIHDRQIAPAARQRQVLEDYNEANGYSGADALTLEEVERDQIIGGTIQYDKNQQMLSQQVPLDNVKVIADAN